jgi:hypothetical protein
MAWRDGKWGGPGDSGFDSPVAVPKFAVMKPWKNLSPLSMALALGGLTAGLTWPGYASEKATITAPAYPPAKKQPPKKAVEAPTKLSDFKTGSTGVNVDAIPLPTVPSIDPKAARQLREKIQREEDWLLETDTGKPKGALDALEESWDLDDGSFSSTRTGAVERKMRTKDREQRKAATGAEADSALEDDLDRKTPRRGRNTLADGEDEDLRSTLGNNGKKGADMKVFGFPTGEALNPFESTSKSKFNERVGGASLGLETLPAESLDSAFKSSEAEYNRRLERLGLSGSADGRLEEPALRADSFGQERQLRADQFTQSLGSSSAGNSAASSGLSGLTTKTDTGLGLPSLAKPMSPVGSFFDKPLGSDFVKPLASPLPSAGGSGSRATDFLRAGGSGFAPIPKTGF